MVESEKSERRRRRALGDGERIRLKAKSWSPDRAQPQLVKVQMQVVCVRHGSNSGPLVVFTFPLPFQSLAGCRTPGRFRLPFRQHRTRPRSDRGSSSAPSTASSCCSPSSHSASTHAPSAWPSPPWPTPSSTSSAADSRLTPSGTGSTMSSALEGATFVALFARSAARYLPPLG